MGRLGRPRRFFGVARQALPVVSAIPAAVLAATLPAPAPVHGVAGFGDVAEGEYFTEAVQWMVDANITTGTSQACFSPDDPVSRGQAAAFLWRMEGEPAAPRRKFSDVTAAYQQSAVAWLARRSRPPASGPTRFFPDEELSRGEFAVMLHRVAGQPSAGPHPFSDVTAPLEQRAVAWLAAESITTGTGHTTFSPDEPITRAQLAAFLYRYKGRPEVELDPSSPRCTTPKVTLGFGGDLQILDYQIPLGMLVAITDILSAPDLMFANLETVVGTRGEVGPPPINKSFNFLSPPEAIDQIVASGIDVLGMANNHT